MKNKKAKMSKIAEEQDVFGSEVPGTRCQHGLAGNTP
jgi:hypothetical protein